MQGHRPAGHPYHNLPSQYLQAIYKQLKSWNRNGVAVGRSVAVGLGVGVGVGEGVGVNVAVGSGSKQVATNSRSRSMVTVIVLEFHDAPWGTLPSQAPKSAEHWAVTTTSLPSG